MKEKYLRFYREYSISEKRIGKALGVIQEFLSIRKNPYIAFSGGKDSTVMMYLVSLLGNKEIPVFTQGDDLDFPDKEGHCRGVVDMLGFSNYSYVYSDVSAMEQIGKERITGTFWEVIEKYREEIRADGVFMGLRAQESKARTFVAKKKGVIYDVRDDVTRCLPVLYWRAEEIFAFIIQKDLPFHSIYDKSDLIEKYPHEMRFSWMYSPRFSQWGALIVLKKMYPDLARRLIMKCPQLRSYL